MSSTKPSPVSSDRPLGRFAERYTGPEFRQAAALPLDPLLYPDPQRPSWIYVVVVWVAGWLMKLLWRVQVEGQERLPQPPFIIASNHLAWYDAIFILGALSGGDARAPMIYTMARQDTVFNRRWKRWLLPRLGVFPILPRKGELDERGMRITYQILARQGVVLIFPEGRYSKGRELQPLKKGVAHFALQAGVPICPVALSGLEHLNLRRHMRISVGSPVWPDPPKWWTLNRRVMRIVDDVRRSILQAFGPAV
jgi:1-acyl-sn-glycerol-3-phosphate acyltransferase